MVHANILITHHLSWNFFNWPHMHYKRCFSPSPLSSESCTISLRISSTFGYGDLVPHIEPNTLVETCTDGKWKLKRFTSTYRPSYLSEYLRDLGLLVCWEDLVISRKTSPIRVCFIFRGRLSLTPDTLSQQQDAMSITDYRSASHLGLLSYA
jgi:hypothetical protein